MIITFNIKTAHAKLKLHNKSLLPIDELRTHWHLSNKGWGDILLI